MKGKPVLAATTRLKIMKWTSIALVCLLVAANAFCLVISCIYFFKEVV